jgi:hypothetical protein
MSRDVCCLPRRNAEGIVIGSCGGLSLLVLLAVVGLARAGRTADPEQSGTDGGRERPAVAMAEGSLPPAVLDLPRDGYLTGTLLDSPAKAAGGRSTFRWQSPAFAEPFECAVDGVVGIRFLQPPAGGRSQPAGDWRIELNNGDQLVAGLESIDERQVVATIGPVATPTRLVVPRAALWGMFRSDSEAVYAGPGGLAGWQQAPPESWREEAGRLANTTEGASLFRDLPSRDARAGLRTRYDMTLSWQERPTLRIAVACSGVADLQRAFCLELRPEGLVAVREEGGGGDTGRADLQPCGDMPANGIALTVFVDQQAGRLAVLLPGGHEPVADFTLPPAGNQPGSGVRFTVLAGKASLDFLRVSPWQGDAVAVADRQEGVIRLRDGAELAAVVQGMQPAAAGVMVRSAEAAAQPRPIPLDQIEGILFPTGGLPAANPASDAESAGGSSVVRVTDVAGSRLSGRLVRVEQGTVWLKHPAVEEPMPLPMGMLAAVACPGPPVEEPPRPGRIGRLVGAQGRVWGCLVSGAGEDRADGSAASAVRWQPLGSLTASPLALGPDGEQPQATITYVDASGGEESAAGGVVTGGIGGQIGVVNGRPALVMLIAGSAAERAGVRPGEVILAIAPRGDGRFVDTAGLSREDTQQLLRGRVGTRLQLRLQRNGPGRPREIVIVRQALSQLGRDPQLLQQALQVQERLLPSEVATNDTGAPSRTGSLVILRTGETLPCRVEAIDESGVRVQVANGDPVTVAADMVQAVELVPAAGKEVTAEKFRSLTMLPRSQRQQPPTHVLRSLQGDYLRGRLVSMDDQTVRIAVEAHPRDTPLAIPRADVARLIWLHPENLATSWEPPQTQAGGGLPVEAVAGNGSRLRMLATGLEGNVLLGTSPVVGPCSIDLQKTDRLLIGGAVDAAPQPLPYAQWKLQFAPEPRNLPPRRP